MHHLSCLQLEKLIDKITTILTVIESARPRGQSGILALCSLHQCMEKCKLLLRYCSESSKLYLAITGERIIWRCERIRYSMEACLKQLQDMVAPKLATQISDIVNYIRTVAFTIDSSEKEAGKVLLALLQKDREASSFDDLEELKAFKFAAFRLQITSPMALMIEKQSIKELLSKIRDTDPAAKKILNYLLYLVRKYGDSIEEEEPKITSNYESNEEPEGDDYVSIQSSDMNSVDYVTDSSTEDGSGKIINIHDESERFKSRDTNNGTDLFVLEKFSVLPWALKCKVVEDVINELKDDDGSRSFISTGYINSVFKFLKMAHRLGDSRAKRNGAKLLLMFLNECRSEVPLLMKEAMHYLYYLLDLEIIEEALPILELLSFHQHYSSEIVSSGVPSFLLQLIKNPDSKHHDFALRILCNLSAHTDLGDHLVYLGFIQHLMPFLDDSILSVYCVKIFRNLCTIEEAAAQLIEDENCIESIGEILCQGGVDEEQENALHILLCLCHQHEELREVLKQESIVSSLVDISQNESSGGKLISMKLLQFLNNDQECCVDVVESEDQLKLFSTNISVS